MLSVLPFIYNSHVGYGRLPLTNKATPGKSWLEVETCFFLLFQSFPKQYIVIIIPSAEETRHLFLEHRIVFQLI